MASVPFGLSLFAQVSGGFAYAGEVVSLMLQAVVPMLVVPHAGVRLGLGRGAP